MLGDFDEILIRRENSKKSVLWQTDIVNVGRSAIAKCIIYKTIPENRYRVVGSWGAIIDVAKTVDIPDEFSR